MDLTPRLEDHMRKIHAIAATAAAAAGLILTVSSPAQAATSVRGVYFSYSDCVSVGDAGVLRGTWTTYTCQYVPNQGRVVYYLMA
jgi:hypothetical protein